MPPVVLITGASRGIGRATALEFASHGYHTVITCAHSETNLYALKDEIESTYHTPCTTFIGDIGDYTNVTELFSRIPTIDVLVNNAGVAYFGLLSEMSVDDWQHVMGTNLNSCFYTSKLAIPLMLKKGAGRIINVSSVWGNVGASMEVAYSASKGGINSFTKGLAKELAPSNIQVNAIAFGAIDTDMNKTLSEDTIETLKNEIPCNRLGTPKEAADLIWQVANSPSYLTGQIITMDGGWC